MSIHRNVLVLVATLAWLFQPLVGLGTAHAQVPINPDSVGIWLSIDDGAPSLAGEIFREGADPEHYVEHWVLYPNYVYPSVDNGAVITLKPGLRRYESARDFLARVPFQAGARYVKVDCLDHEAFGFVQPPEPDRTGPHAQVPLDPDSVAVWLEGPGSPVLAGEVYRDGSDPAHYTEHWALNASYVYPSSTNGLVVKLVPGFKRYRNAEDFLSRVPFEKGSRYVEADCLDGDAIPGR